MVKDISEMDHAHAAGTLRILERAGSKKHAEMLALCERAAETAPPEEASLWARRLNVYRAGRTVKVAIGEIAFLDGLDVRTIDEIEEVFSNAEGEQS